MPKIFATVKRVIVQGGAGIIFGLQAGTKATLRVTKNAVLKSVGTAHSVTKAVTVDQKAGTEKTVFVTGDAARLDHATGITHGAAIAPNPQEKAQAVAMTRVAVSNTTIYEIETVAQLSGDEWADIADFQGYTADEASLTGGTGLAGLTPKDGAFRGTFASPNATKDNQTIESVTLEFYRRQTGTLLGNGTLTADLTGALSKAVDSQTGNVDGLVTVDLTADIGQDWGKLRGLNLDISGSSATLGRSCFARQARITVISNRTITL